VNALAEANMTQGKEPRKNIIKPHKQHGDTPEYSSHCKTDNKRGNEQVILSAGPMGQKLSPGDHAGKKKVINKVPDEATAQKKETTNTEREKLGKDGSWRTKERARRT